MMSVRSIRLLPPFELNGLHGRDDFKVLAILSDQCCPNPTAAKRDQDIIKEGMSLGFEMRVSLNNLSAHHTGLFPIMIEWGDHSVDALKRFVEGLSPFHNQVMGATNEKLLNNDATKISKGDSAVIFGFVVTRKVAILHALDIDVRVKDVSTWHRGLLRHRSRHFPSMPSPPLLERQPIPMPFGSSPSPI